MPNILVVLGSAREGRIADVIAPFVTDELKLREGVTTTIADLKELDLPFYNHPMSPAQPGFVPTDERVVAWTKLVADADGVIFLTPEYNHALTAIQKNAIDWIKNEWVGKPVSLVAYGWSGGSLAIEDADKVLTFLETSLQRTYTHIFFTKEIAPDGAVIDEAKIVASVKATVDELLSVV